MLIPRHPENEAQRVATLKHMGLLDVPPLERFERMTRLATAVFGVPYALITLVDSERQWFLSRGGGWQVEQTPREISFCAHAILGGEALLILDSLSDPRFADNPLVSGPPHIRFYAGYPLQASDGTRFGTLCLIDRKPWASFSETQLRQLHDLAKITEQEFLLTQASQNLRGDGDDLGEVLRETVTITGEAAVNPIDYQRARRRIAALYETSRLLIDPFRPLEELGESVLGEIGEPEGWEYGGLWVTDREELRMTASWHHPGQVFRRFEDLSRRSVFTRGLGLLGRVIESREPFWVADVVEVTEFTRADAAETEGLRCGVFLPIRGASGELHGALEYFSRDICHPDDGQLKLLAVVGTLIGRFLDVREGLNERMRLLAREADMARQLSAALELDRLKTELTNSVSHELRTPLTILMGYAELLEDSVESRHDVAEADYIKNIRRAIARLDRLVADMLDDARITAGTFRLRLAECDLADIARNVVEELRPIAAGAGVELALELEEPELPLLADGDRLGQVLTNFTTNAIKFTPTGGRATLRCRRATGRLHCEVEDTGRGIAEEDLPKLFTRFSQLSAGRRQKSGTGLGLSIAKAIVEAHGGEVGVESGQGRGATFWFQVPPAPDEDSAVGSGA